MENYKQDSLSSLGLKLDDEVKDQLMQTSKWTKFISVSIFCFAAFTLLAGIFGGSAILYALKNNRELDQYLYLFSSVSGGIIFAIALVLFVFFLGTYYFLFRFSTKIKAGIINENGENINQAFNAMKIFFIITTVLGILMLFINVKNLFN